MDERLSNSSTHLPNMTRGQNFSKQLVGTEKQTTWYHMHVPARPVQGGCGTLYSKLLLHRSQTNSSLQRFDIIVVDADELDLSLEAPLLSARNPSPATGPTLINVQRGA